MTGSTLVEQLVRRMPQHPRRNLQLHLRRRPVPVLCSVIPPRALGRARAVAARVRVLHPLAQRQRRPEQPDDGRRATGSPSIPDVVLSRQAGFSHD